MFVSDEKMLPRDSFTHISGAHGTTSWLDHGIYVLIIRSICIKLNNIRILDESPFHLLVSCILNIVFSDHTPFNNC